MPAFVFQIERKQGYIITKYPVSTLPGKKKNKPFLGIHGTFTRIELLLEFMYETEIKS